MLGENIHFLPLLVIEARLIGCSAYTSGTLNVYDLDQSTLRKYGWRFKYSSRWRSKCMIGDSSGNGAASIFRVRKLENSTVLAFVTTVMNFFDTEVVWCKCVRNVGNFNRICTSQNTYQHHSKNWKCQEYVAATRKAKVVLWWQFMGPNKPILVLVHDDVKIKKDE